MNTAANESFAHRLSARSGGVDPCRGREFPEPERPRWLYLRQEYECFMLARRRRETERLKLHVSYPGEFRTPWSRIWFRRYFPEAAEFGLRISGETAGREVRFSARPGWFTLEVGSPDPLATAPGIASSLSGWEASADGVTFSPAVPGGDPDGWEPPRAPLTLQEFEPGSFDAGREVLADFRIYSPTRPRLRCGESRCELENRDPGLAEQSCELHEGPPGCWRPVGPLALRYLAVETDQPFRLEAEQLTSRARYRGAFAADPELERIWFSAAYTLRLCRSFFLIDGIKRDRLPWVGDLALGLLAEAYTFGDPEPVRRTLTVLGAAGIRKSHLNGLVDYSLWFLISHDWFQRYFGDAEFLIQEWPTVREIVAVLLELSRGGELMELPGQRSFIDWVEGPRETAVRMLLCWSLTAAAELAGRLEQKTLADRCRSRAAEVRERLLTGAFDAGRGWFRARSGGPPEFLRHPNFLAILAGVGGDCFQVPGYERLPPVGTPYMRALELLAMHRAGHTVRALELLRQEWGAMLAAGGTTFFEARFDPGRGDENYAFYGRPYARSLCHAWSSGPAALLPIMLFGCEPESDGWRSFRLEPLPGRDVRALTVPTPGGGAIEVELQNGRMCCRRR